MSPAEQTVIRCVLTAGLPVSSAQLREVTGLTETPPSRLLARLVRCGVLLRVSHGSFRPGPGLHAPQSLSPRLDGVRVLLVSRFANMVAGGLRDGLREGLSDTGASVVCLARIPHRATRSSEKEDDM